MELSAALLAKLHQLKSLLAEAEVLQLLRRTKLLAGEDKLV